MKMKLAKLFCFLLTPLVFLDELLKGVLRAFKETWGHIVDTWNT